MIFITMPKWGLSMEEGQVVEWLVSEGSELSNGDEIAEIETTKLTSVLEFNGSGVVARIVANTNEELPVGALMAVVVESENELPSVDTAIAEFQENFDPKSTDNSIGQEFQFVDINCGGIRYFESGSGEKTVILVHGFGADLLGWGMVQQTLSSSFRTISLDLPGHGESTKLVGNGSIEFFADALEEFMAKCGIDKAVLVGHSLGGAVAMSLAARHLSVVEAAVAVAPIGLGSELDASFIHELIANTRPRKLRPVMEKLVSDPTFVTQQMLNDFIKSKRIEGATEALTSIGSAIIRDNGQRVDLRSAMNTIEAPCLIIWGRQDRIVPAEHVENVPEKVSVVIFDGAGHMPYAEKHAEFCEVVKRFATDL